MQILIVDDERIIRVTTADELREAGYSVQEFASAKAVLQYLREQRGKADVLLTDLKMPDMDGLSLTKEVRSKYPHIYVLLMTAHASVNSAVEVMKLGAYDYIQKPFNMDELLLSLERIAELKRIKEENKQLRKEVGKSYNMSSFVGEDPETKKIFDMVQLIAAKDTTVLITGETGTGKELLTSVLHHNSNRGKEPFIKVSCAILSREIFESELFGHVKGAFTGADTPKAGRFEMASKGTLYLDDVDDIPVDLQVKLLRALEEGEIERVGGSETIKVDVRVIASTKKDLQQLVAEGRFREDLFYRLNVFPIRLPPLRERPHDIKLLAMYFANEFAGPNGIEINEEVLEIMKQYSFPGNVRELKNLMERMVILAGDGAIEKHMLPMEVRFPGKPHTCFYFENKPLELIVREVEENAIRDALLRSGGNKAKAAKILSVPASTLKSRIDKLNI